MKLFVTVLLAGLGVVIFRERVWNMNTLGAVAAVVVPILITEMLELLVRDIFGRPDVYELIEDLKREIRRRSR